MNKPKYTQGDWKYIDGRDTKLSKPDATMIYIEIGQTRIAELDLCGTDPNYTESELRANAKLMAAAPELLESLSEAIEYFGRIYKLGQERRMLDKWEKVAIKAKGEQ